MGLFRANDEIMKQIIQVNKLTWLKIPTSWQVADQLAIYKKNVAKELN